MGDSAPSGGDGARATRTDPGKFGFRASESFAGCFGIRRSALAGRATSLKEYTIGVEALGRSASFDPHLDTIVRFQARKLRGTIGAYYAAEGVTLAPHRVPRSYLPAFHRRGGRTPAAPAGQNGRRPAAHKPHCG